MRRFRDRLGRELLCLCSLASAATTLLACNDVSLAQDEEALVLTWDEQHGYPQRLELLDVATGTTEAVPLFTTNAGNAAVEITRIALVAGLDDLVEDGEAAVLVDGDTMVFHVQYTPLSEGERTDTLVVDASSGSLHVPMVLSSFGDPVPDAYAEPTAYDFGEVEAHTSERVTIVVGNAGMAPLQISDVSLTGPGSDAFLVEDDTLSGTTLGQDDPPVGIDVTFSPTRVESYQASLSIDSDDPDEGTVVVPLVGTGWSPAGDGPVALCSVDPAVAQLPGAVATWIGHESYDAGGGALANHVWRLAEAPAGSAAQMPYCTGSSDCGPFVPDLVGSYIGELYVQDEFGQSATCTAELVAEPTPALWVELSWTLEADDLDLHLLAPGGEPHGETDCYWATCQWSTPDWGEAGVAEDDPSMDLDDIEGTGPEVVEIPLPADGVYTVFVHDFTGSNPEAEAPDPEEANEATVRVYAAGQLAFTRSVLIEGEGVEEYVCEATWPDGSVEPY